MFHEVLSVGADSLTRKRSQVQTLSRPPHKAGGQAGSVDSAFCIGSSPSSPRAANEQQRRSEPTATTCSGCLSTDQRTPGGSSTDPGRPPYLWSSRREAAGSAAWPQPHSSHQARSRHLRVDAAASPPQLAQLPFGAQTV